MGNNTPSRGEDMGQPVKTTLFQADQSGFTYRIPALIYLGDMRTFLAFAEKRTSSSDSDAKVLVMRRGTLQDDGGIQWSSCQELSTASLPDHRTMNPCPVYEKHTKTLFLFFICVFGHTSERRQIVTGRNRTRLCYVTSGDGGQSWSGATDATESAVGKKRLRSWATFGVGPGHGVQLEAGRLVVPAYAYYAPLRCCCFPLPLTVRPRALSLYSDDFGRTWRAGEMLRRKSCECEMAEVVDQEGRSHLYCNARNTRGYRLEALSESSGADFHRPRVATALPEPRHGCQGSVVAFPAPELLPDAAGVSLLSPGAQTWLLFTHPTGRPGRRDLGVYLNRSPLHPAGWDRPWIVHGGPGGYSDLAYCEDREERFSCLMECGEKSELEQIAFVSFTLADVMQKGGEKKNTL